MYSNIIAIHIVKILHLTPTIYFMGCGSTFKQKTENTQLSHSQSSSNDSFGLRLRLSNQSGQIIEKKYILRTIKEVRPNLESSQSFKNTH